MKWPGIALAFVASVACVATLQAAIIGETNDWVTLSEGAKQFDLSQATVDMLLDAGGEVTCIRKNAEGKRTLSTSVGWLVSRWPGKVLMNAHTLGVETNDGAHLRPASDFSNCYFSSNRAVRVIGMPVQHAIVPDPDQFRIGGTAPDGYDAKGDVYIDRMLVPLTDDYLSVNPIDLEPSRSIKPGEAVFMVTAARAYHPTTQKGGFEPLIQRCHVIALEDALTGPLVLTTATHKRVCQAASSSFSRLMPKANSLRSGCRRERENIKMKLLVRL